MGGGKALFWRGPLKGYQAKANSEYHRLSDKDVHSAEEKGCAS